MTQVDRPGVRDLAIDGTTTFRASARTLTHTQPVAVPSVAEAVERMRAGQADAFALSRDTLRPVVGRSRAPDRQWRLPADTGRRRRSEGPSRRPCRRDRMDG